MTVEVCSYDVTANSFYKAIKSKLYSYILQRIINRFSEQDPLITSITPRKALNLNLQSRPLCNGTSRTQLLIYCRHQSYENLKPCIN